MDNQSTKPKEEVWNLGKGTTIHNSIGCEHELRQVDATKVICDKCGLGLFGFLDNKGKLTDTPVY